MCQQCTQKAVELESKINALKEETLKLASMASLAYTNVGAMGAAAAIGLMRPHLNEVQAELLCMSTTMCVHILNEADRQMQELFGKSMELGMLRSVQEALFMAESAGAQLGTEFAEGHGTQPKKKVTVH